MKLTITISIIIVFVVTAFVLVTQSYYSPERKMLHFNSTVVSAIENRFDSIVSNPICQYSDAHPPAVGSVPECNWRMKWITNGAEQLLTTARSEDVSYDSSYPLRPSYIQQQLNDYFQTHSFKINQENTRVEKLSPTGEQKNYIYAYENDIIRCSLTIPELLADGRSSYAPPFVVVGCYKIE